MTPNAPRPCIRADCRALFTPTTGTHTHCGPACAKKTQREYDATRKRRVRSPGPIPREAASRALPCRCAACGARLDYSTDGDGHVVALACVPCARQLEQRRALAYRAELHRERPARRQALLAALGALFGAHYSASVTPTQHRRARWRRKAKRAAERRKELGLPRAETARQRAQRRAGVAKLRADPVYCAIENIRRRERAAALRAQGIKRKRSGRRHAAA